MPDLYAAFWFVLACGLLVMCCVAGVFDRKEVKR